MTDNPSDRSGDRSALVPPRPRVGPRIAIGAVVVVALAAAGGFGWLRWHKAPEPVETELPAAAAPAPAPAASAASAVAAAPAPEPQAAEAPLTADGVGPALTKLLGSRAALSMFQLEDFPRRFVATVDNLGRAHAPSMVWPVRPTAGRFATVERDGQEFIAADNAARYAGLVTLVETLDTQAVAALYVRLLPLLQQAYEEQGFPRQRFHTRLLAVIDQLLAAPEPNGPIALTLTDVKGSIPSERPWVRYEFADPALESASAGQKIMVRMGSANERRLKAKLKALRAELVAQASR